MCGLLPDLYRHESLAYGEYVNVVPGLEDAKVGLELRMRLLARGMDHLVAFLVVAHPGLGQVRPADVTRQALEALGLVGADRGSDEGRETRVLSGEEVFLDRAGEVAPLPQFLQHLVAEGLRGASTAQGRRGKSAARSG